MADATPARRRYSSPAESLAARSVRDGDCLRWTGFRQPGGYGQMKAGGAAPELVHRVAYRLAHGSIPDGYQIDHLCRVRDCVNPDHLEAVTQQENLSRKSPPEPAARTHCGRGHELTPENTYQWRTQRHCRTCKREKARILWVPEHEMPAKRY